MVDEINIVPIKLGPNHKTKGGKNSKFTTIKAVTAEIYDPPILPTWVYSQVNFACPTLFDLKNFLKSTTEINKPPNPNTIKTGFKFIEPLALNLKPETIMTIEKKTVNRATEISNKFTLNGCVLL